MSPGRYYGPDWEQIREDVISDDGCCVICTSGSDLVVHHRTPLTEFDSVEKANNMSNLATLCQRCHRRIEEIQKPHTRRGSYHFKTELRAEGVGLDGEALDDLFDWLCFGEVVENPDGLGCCDADGCFYPVKREMCPKCGSLNKQSWMGGYQS